MSGRGLAEGFWPIKIFGYISCQLLLSAMWADLPPGLPARYYLSDPSLSHFLSVCPALIWKLLVTVINELSGTGDFEAALLERRRLWLWRQLAAENRRSCNTCRTYT